MKMRKYANKKNLVKAIRKLEETELAKPIKGRGYERVETSHGEMLAALLGKDITWCRHVCRVFARRSRKAWNTMQWGGDADYVSPKLAKLLDANADHIASLRQDFNGHEEWIVATA